MKKYLKFTSTFMLSVVLFLSGYSLNLLAQDKVTKIDELMTTVSKNGQFNGSVLVAEKGEVIYKKGFGFANMVWNIPNKPDTKFRIGSITKQFVSMVIMQLVEEGKIELNGKLTDYLPDYRKDTGEKITIHHLLTHTSGIPPYTGLPGFWADSSRNEYELDYMIRHFHSNDLEFEPGSNYKYNNSGYFLLAVIVEKITGKSWEANLQERILKPLQMSNSGVDRNEVILENSAAGYIKRLTGVVNEPYFYMINAYGAGDMYSTVENMYLWDQALYSNKLLAQKYKKIMFTPFLNNYAYGWGVRKIALDESDSVQVISHTGGINGFNTIIFRLIKDKHLIVLFNNTGGANLGGLSLAITKILYDKPYEIPKKSLAETIGEALIHKDINSAIKLYHDLKNSQKDNYTFNEGELNRLGYQLLEIERVKEAIQIFKLNIEEYPEDSNPYDSLGEAYMINGDKELAIKNYAKSLELNPKNTNAIVQLKRISETK
ncbi:serine hydrolase [candidate division KSB1 bacterium]|nr:serine hydrolase [candidate division KSB1 bacterium]